MNKPLHFSVNLDDSIEITDDERRELAIEVEALVRKVVERKLNRQ